MAEPPLWEGGGIATDKRRRLNPNIKANDGDSITGFLSFTVPPSLPKRWLCHAHSKVLCTKANLYFAAMKKLAVIVRSGDGWKVLTIFWEEEDVAHPIPAQYLPKR